MRRGMETICRDKQFRRLYRQGKSVVRPLLVVYYKRNGLKNNRVGITASKAVGGAVQRNRARRVIREAYRLLSPRTLPGYDLVFVARGKTPFCKSTQVREQLQKQLSEAGVLQPGQDASPVGKMR